jgi:hypothetical protein
MADVTDPINERSFIELYDADGTVSILERE